jgi:hypothetical protein
MQALDAELERLQKDYSRTMADGEFDKTAAVQAAIARVASRQEEQRRAELQYIEAQNRHLALPPVEQFLNNNRGVYSAEEERWIRAHPQYAEQPGFQSHVVRAHQEALNDGIQRGSNHYFARLDRAAARLMGEDAHAAQPLGPDEFDIARSTYAATHPDDPRPSDADVQKYWNRAKHSDNAYRIKENWVA